VVGDGGCRSWRRARALTADQPLSLTPPNLTDDQVAAAVVLRAGWTWQGETSSSSSSSSSSSAAAAAENTAPASAAAAAASASGGSSLTLAQLQEHCRAAGLTAYKLPRRVAAVQELPRNSGGKVVKPTVQNMLLTSQPRSAL